MILGKKDVSVFKECHRAAVEHGLSWAVAGRSEGKLLAVLDRAGKAVAADLSTIPVIVSDFHQCPTSYFNQVQYVHLDR